MCDSYKHSAMPFNIMALGVTTLSIITFSITTFSTMKFKYTDLQRKTFCIMTLSITIKSVTLSKMSLSIQTLECMMNVTNRPLMPIVILKNVAILSVIILSPVFYYARDKNTTVKDRIDTPKLFCM